LSLLLVLGEIKNNTKIKSSGQECPLHTN
jgi:hypothetical protein